MPVRRHPMAVPGSGAPLHALALDLALVDRLKAVHARVRGPRLADLFYAKLFAAAPHLRPLFRADAATQAEKLASALDAVVRSFEHPSDNASMLAALGKRHAAYGARPEHYALVIDLLVDAMREVLEIRGDDQGLADWRMTLRLISDQMISASDRADPAPRAPQTPGEHAHRR